MRTLPIISSVLLLAAAVHAVEQGASATTTEGVPGGTFVKTVDTTAEVTAIDGPSRSLTVRYETGKSSTIALGPEAVNFDQIKVGDTVRIRLAEQLVVAMADAAAPPKDEAAALVALAPEGAKPGGVVARTVRVTATVTALDLVNRHATVTFPDGSAKTLRVRQDVDLQARKVGEQVTFVLTESIALSVEKPADR